MVKELFKIGRRGFRVSKGGIIFKQTKGPGKTTGEKIIILEKRYGPKNVEVIKKGGRYQFFVRTGQKAEFV